MDEIWNLRQFLRVFLPALVHSTVFSSLVKPLLPNDNPVVEYIKLYYSSCLRL